MRLFKNSAAVALILLAGLGAHAGLGTGIDLNEVGSFLVYPAVVALEGQNVDWETFITVTNTDFLNPHAVHVSYINGNEDDLEYCFECDFSIDLTNNDTELMVVTFTAGGIQIESEDGTVEQSCPHPFGFITINLESTEIGFPPFPPVTTLTNNVLLGSEIVVNYTQGYAYSLPAITIQGGTGNGDRAFSFDGTEYPLLPSAIGADFIAPDINLNQVPYIFADLALFTLGFDRQHPPEVDCSVTGYDAAENPFSRSFIFGCWTLRDLCSIHPEFCYPNLGHAGARDTHGWFSLNCRVDEENNGSFDALGGVHGAIIQRGKTGGEIRREDATPLVLLGDVAWARLLFQSITTGDPVTLFLEEAGGGSLN